MCWRSVSGGHNRRWIHIEDDAVGPSNKQGHLISNEFFRGTDLLRRAPSVRREEYEAMEGLTTTSSQPSSYGVPQSKGKQLQLTPLWEHIVKNNQLPPETDKDVLFQELVLRMSDLEWEVRGHALRVLLDLIPVMELSELDRYMMPTMLQELTYNLGHSSPSVRKGALDTLGVYLTHSTDPETVLRDIVREGLESKTLNNPAKGNIALGVILGIPSLVNPLLSPKDGIVLISQTGLIHLVSALSKKLVQDTYQEQSLKTLVRIREMVGETRFDRFLEGFHPQCKKDFDILCQVYDVTSLGDSGIDLQASSQSAHGYWSESSSTRAASSSTLSPEEMQFQDQNQNYIFIDDKTSSSDSSPSPKEEEEEEEEGVQVVQEETEQPADDESINADGYESFQAMPDEEGSAMMAAEEDGDREEQLEVLIEERAVSRMDHDDPENVEPEEEAITVIEGEPMDEGVLNSSRVILETEIKFNEDDAIMMTIMEEGDKAEEQTRVEEQEETQMPESDEGYRVYNNDYVVKVMTDDEDYDDNEDVAMADHPIRRTPRRVRFGGEMVMMRTPDSEDGREGQAIDQEESNADQEADIEGDETITTDTGEIVAIEDARQDSVENARRDSLVNIQEDDTLDEALQPEYTAEDEARQDLIDYLNEEEAPEDVQYVGMENTRRDSFRRQDTIIENSSRQNSVEDSRQNSVQDSGQNSVQESRQNSVQESRQNSVQDSRQNSVQDSRQNSLENGRRSSIADSRQDSLENSRRASIQDIRQDSLETSRNNFVSDSRQNSVEKGRRSSIEDSRQNSLENNNRRSSIQEVRQDSVESRRDSMQSNRQSSLESRRGSVQAESIIEVPEETIQVLRSDSVEDDSRPAIQVVLEDDEQQAIQVIPDDDPDQNMPALQSHIPLPVAPAKSIPRDHRKRGSLYKKRLQRGSQGSGSQEQSVDSKGSSVSGSEGDAPEDNPTPAPTPAPAGDNAGDSSDGKEDVNPEEEDPEDLGPDWEDFGIVPNRVVEDMQDQVVGHQEDEKEFEGHTVVHICGECARTLWEMLMSEEWVSRIHGIESLSNALKDPEVLHSLMPCLPSLLHTLLVTMADDKNYRVATCSIGAVRSLINSLPFTIIQENLSQIIKGLTRHIGGAGSVNLKIETAAVAKTLMLMMKPNPVVEILLTPDCIGAKSSKLRENSLLFLIYATLMFPSTEFHWDRMTEKVASAVADPRRRVRLAALDALSVIAQFTTPSLLDEAVKTTADKQPNFATRVAYLAGVQARLARRQLPTTSQDGLILYVLQIPSARTSGKGVFSASPIGMFGPCPSLGRQVLAVAAPWRASGALCRDKRQHLKQLLCNRMSTECIRLHHQQPPLKLNQQLPPLKFRTLRELGSDVDWVLSGSGSLSSGSAKSRAQLIAAQRIDPQAGNFPEELQAVTVRNKWTERKGTVAAGVQSRVQSASLAPIHSATPKKDEPRSRTSVTTWTTDLDVNNIKASQSPKHSQIVRAGVLSPPDVANLGNHSVLKGSFSLLPNRLTQSTLISEGVGQEQLNQTWPPPTSGRHSPRIPKSSSKKRGRRILEPLNGPGSPFQGVSPMIMPRGKSPGTKAPSRGTSPRPRGTSSMSRGVSPVARSPSPMPIRSTSSGRHKIPPLSPRKKKEPVEASAFVNLPSFKDDEIIDLASLRRARRRKRSTNRGKGIIAIEHEPPQADEEQHVELSYAQGDVISVDDFTIPQKPMLARQGIRHDISQANILPENSSKLSNGLFTPPAEPFLPPVDPPSPPMSKSRISPPPPPQDEMEFKSLDENDVPTQEDPPPNAMPSAAAAAIDVLEAEERALKFQLLKEQEQVEPVTVSRGSVVSASGGIETPVTTTEVIELDSSIRGSVPSLKSQTPPNDLLSREESMETMPTEQRGMYTTGSIIDLHLDVEDPLQNSITAPPTRQTRHVKRGTLVHKNSGRTLRGTQIRDNSRSQPNNALFPDSLRPVDKPRESMQLCFAQLNSAEWEVVMQGLQLLVRLMRHHPEVIHTHLHSVIVAVAKQVRNLRSQVARAACQASSELLQSQKRAVETDVDELVSPLLHRTADTNRFLRADSNAALDRMMEVLSPPKAVSVIVGKGISHQNAIVRTASARLLVNLVSRVGVEKVMTYPGDMRDKILITGSKLLTEGSLDTRCFAKQLFRLLSTYPTFNTTMTEIVPSQILRNISKTLQSLR